MNKNNTNSEEQFEGGMPRRSVPPAPPVKKKKRSSAAAPIILVCLLFFGMGIFVGMQGKQGASSAEFDKLQTVYNTLSDRWYYGSSDQEFKDRLLEQAITGMSTLEEDIHTNYFSLEQAEAFSKALAGSSVGIGIGFYPDANGNMVVKSVYTNSTADKAGLQPGDVIVQVGDQQADGTASEDLIAYIQGREGKDTDLQVVRDGQTMTITVTPGTFDNTVSLQLDPADEAGIITLSSFSEYSGKDFADAAARARDAGMKNLIIDLRSNSGGYLSAVQDIASSLLPDDTVIFQEQTRDGNRKDLKTSKSYAMLDFDHIYLLQNEGTASASEVLIGALKDNLGDGKVTTIGTQSYGKGTEQVTQPFADGTSIKYTVAEWLTPNGTSINKVGFTPDVEVKESEARTVTYRTMEEGEVIMADSVNDNARALQVYLAYLGYPVDRTDTYFSAAGSQALAAFQADHGFEATGSADQQVMDALVDAVSTRLNSMENQEDQALAKVRELIAGS